MQKVKITAGEHIGKIATITNNQKDYFGASRIYELKDENCQKLWNGQFSNFPESFTEIIND